MITFEKIRHKLGNRILKHKFKSLKREKKFYSLSDTKSIGILFDASNEKSFKEAKAIITEFDEQGKRVYALGFVEKTETIGNYLYKKEVDFFSISKLKWNGIPESDTVNTFIENKFDMLIDLTLSNYFPLKYIMALSKAEFKVSSKIHEEYADFVIDIDKNNTVKYFMEQVKHYLNIIKRA